MQNTQTFLNKFFWWIIALLGVMLFLWWLLFSPLFQSTNASTLNSQTANSTPPTSMNGDEGYDGVNFRKTPCGELAGDYKAWNLKGVVNETPVTDESCPLGKYTWHLVQFDDNTSGWIVEDNLTFSTSK